MTTAPNRRWFRIVIIALSTAAILEAPLVPLVLTSVVPYSGVWSSTPEGTTTTFAYWDGHTDTAHSKDVPVWVYSTVGAVIVANAMLFAALGIAAWHWWRQRRA